MKQSMFSKQGQKGFTLLELLIVVTIIAILSVGAILAYDGLTDKAQSATAANNTVTADQSIRSYRAVSGNYPNQWDHLIVQGGTDDGEQLEFVAEETYVHLAKLDATALSAAITAALDEVGIDELQVRDIEDATANVEPNLQHNEGASPADSEDLDIGTTFPNDLVVIPTASSSTLCGIGANKPVEIGTVEDSLIDQGADAAQNYVTKLNDSIGENNCHLIVAMGFGHDAAHSTQKSNAAIAAAPAYVSNKINPSQNYARFLALFDLGEDNDNDQTFQADEINTKAVFIGVIDPEGNVIDENVAEANDEGQEEEDDD